MFPDAFAVYHPAARLRSSVRGIRLAALVATPFFRIGISVYFTCVEIYRFSHPPVALPPHRNTVLELNAVLFCMIPPHELVVKVRYRRRVECLVL